MKKIYCFTILILSYSFIIAQNNNIEEPLGCTGTWYEGEGTYYGGVAGSSGGHCGLPVESGDIYHAAMNHQQYNNSNSCGTCVRILGPKGEITVKIVDECPECKYGDIDMTTGVFPQLAELKDGRIKIKWQYVPCPMANDITLLFAEGSGPYYFKVQVRDANYPIIKMEYRKNDNSYVEISREVYNYYVAPDGIDEDKQKTGPYYFRFTASTGQLLYADSIIFSTTQIVHTGVQFDTISCPDCAGILGGDAKIDNCGVCSGGTTGIVPNSTCVKDCAEYWEGTAYIDGCGICVSGTTGATPCDNDCNNVPGGLAYIDHCGTCVGGNTGRIPCIKDCNNQWGGTAFFDSCKTCAGGTTNISPVLDSSLCNSSSNSIQQQILLQNGWNLISINVTSIDNTIATLFAGLDVQQIKNTDGFWIKGQDSWLNSLQTIEANKGYLVYMNTSGILSITGTPLISAYMPIISTGWNLIGCPFQTSKPFSLYYNDTNTQIIKNFDGFWIPNNTMSTLTQLVPGKGYYLKK